VLRGGPGKLGLTAQVLSGLSYARADDLAELEGYVLMDDLDIQLLTILDFFDNMIGELESGYSGVLFHFGRTLGVTVSSCGRFLLASRESGADQAQPDDEYK
jgi:hypothetical protein